MDITLALGGGGSKGNSHIGVLRRLEKEGFRVRALAGTSFGGIVAMFYAYGYSAAQIEEIFANLDQSRLYGHGANEGPSLLGLAGATKWFNEIFGDKTFADLKIPCALTAVDLNCGCEVNLTEGRLVDALLSTIAIPGVFPPHHFGDWELVDGGVLNPVPISVARSLAPQWPVVAVTLNEALGAPARTWSMPMPSYVPKPIMDRLARMSYAQAFDIFLRSLDIMDRAVAQYRLEADRPEVIVRPAVHDIDMLEKVDVHAVAQLGEDALAAVLPQLMKEVSWARRIKRKFFGKM